MPVKKKKQETVFPRPLHCRIIVSAEKPEQMSAGGIIIPDTAQEQKSKGKVVAVGPGRKDDPMLVKVGDIACYGEYAGTEIEIDGKPYLIMNQNDVLYVN